MKPWILAENKLGMMRHIWNPRTWEMETVGAEVQSHPLFLIKLRSAKATWDPVSISKNKKQMNRRSALKVMYRPDDRCVSTMKNSWFLVWYSLTFLNLWLKPMGIEPSASQWVELYHSQVKFEKEFCVSRISLLEWAKYWMITPGS